METQQSAKLLFLSYSYITIGKLTKSKLIIVASVNSQIKLMMWWTLTHTFCSLVAILMLRLWGCGLDITSPVSLQTGCEQMRANIKFIDLWRLGSEQKEDESEGTTVYSEQSFGFTVKLKLKLEANFREIGLVELITDDTSFLKISAASAKTQKKHNFHFESNWTFHSLTVLEGMKLLFLHMYICVCVYI